MQYTTNLNLKKPEATDLYDIGNENDNMDALDEAVNGKAPKDHASPNSTYGVGSPSAYGHVKMDNALSASSENAVQNKVIHAGKADRTNIAPVEDADNASQDYAIGEQFYRNNVLYKAKTAITLGTAWSSLTLDTDYEAADNVSSQIQAIANNVDGLTENELQNGCVNLLPITASSKVYVGTTYTVNDDGIINVSCNPSTGNFGEIIGSAHLKKGYYKLVGLDDSVDGGYGKIQMYVDRYVNGSWTNTNPFSGKSWINRGKNDKEYNIVYLDADSDIRVNLIVYGNQTYNLVVKPMITLASVPNSDYNHYVPYAKSNRELTKDVYFNTGRQLPIIDLGTEYTAELKADISSGKFEKAVVGGKLTINGHVYYLAHPDYWLHTGDAGCTTHHMLVVPAGNLGNGKMNNDNSTAGGYIGSGMKSGTNHDESANSALADVAAIIKADFGAANILTHREDFTNAVADGKPSAGAWYHSDIDLMNENMVYGTNILLPHPDGSTVPYLYTIDKTQIKLFAERPDLITIRANWWLRDVVSAVGFARVDSGGYAASGSASATYGVRPAFAIC